MFASVILMFAATFAESKEMAVQIHLDRAGYSCSAIDGLWGGIAVDSLIRYIIFYHFLPIYI